MRADKFLFHKQKLGKKAAQQAIRERKLIVNDQLVNEFVHEIGKFDKVEFNGVLLPYEKATYIMLHKPAGYVCATSDGLSPTVIELLKGVDIILHLAGRLDKFTTGLVLLTNDGTWSKSVTMPQSKVPKIYRVSAEKPFTKEMLKAFQHGIYFEKEKIKTQSAVHRQSIGSLSLDIEEGTFRYLTREEVSSIIKI